MRLVLAVLIGAVVVHGQGMPFPGGGLVHDQGGGGGGVTISSHGVTASPSSCANNSTTCAQSGSDTQAVVGVTGDTLVAVVHVASNISVTLPSGCTVTATFGAQSMTFLTAAYNPGVAGNSVSIWPFYLKNATAATDYLSFSISGVGCTFYYVQGIFWADLAGASTTAPIDTSVTNVSTSSGGSQAVTSAGNVTNSGEVGLCFVSYSVAITGYTGAFSLLDSGLTGNGDASLIHPSAGSPITCTATATLGSYGLSLFSVTP